MTIQYNYLHIQIIAQNKTTFALESVYNSKQNNIHTFFYIVPNNKAK